MTTPIPALIKAAMARKPRYVSPDGVTCYLNSADRCAAIAAKHGGKALPPKGRK